MIISVASEQSKLNRKIFFDYFATAWCYVRKRRLEKAILQIDRTNVNVPISWYPFEIKVNEKAFLMFYIFVRINDRKSNLLFFSKKNELTKNHVSVFSFLISFCSFLAFSSSKKKIIRHYFFK